jgi:hypothetical protein
MQKSMPKKIIFHIKMNKKERYIKRVITDLNIKDEFDIVDENR